MGRGAKNTAQVFIDPRQAFEGRLDASRTVQRSFLATLDNNWNEAWRQMSEEPKNPFIGKPPEVILYTDLFTRIYDIAKKQLPKEIRGGFESSNWDSFYKEELAKSISRLTEGNQSSIFFNKPLIYMFEQQSLNEDINFDINSEDLKVFPRNAYPRYLKEFFTDGYEELFYTQWSPDLQRIKEEASSDQCSFSIVLFRFAKKVREEPYDYKDTYFMSSNENSELADKIWDKAGVATAERSKRKNIIKSEAYSGENNMKRRFSESKKFDPETLESFIASEQARIVSNQIISLMSKETGNKTGGIGLEKFEEGMNNISRTGFLKRLDPLFQMPNSYYTEVLYQTISDNKEAVYNASPKELLEVIDSVGRALYKENQNSEKRIRTNDACKAALEGIKSLKI